MTRSSRLEDVLPLSALQEGLLFHALFDERSVDVYTAQLVVDLQGPLDVHRLRAAATALVARHGCLRTGFVRDAGDPLQVVLRDVEVPWVEVDLSRWADEERPTELTRLLDEDRVTRFDMDAPPLVRFMVIKVGPDQHRLVMSNHHIVFDGWSTPVLMRDLFSLYASHGDATSLPAVRPYRDFLVWLSGQDRTAALGAWAQALHGVEGPTLLAPDRRAGGAALPDRVVATVPPELTTRLTRLARTSGVTMNTLVQAGWGIVLARLTGCSDVVFGATVSGRPHQLPGVESMVGLFINSIPVRVRLDPAESVADLLARVQSEQTLLLDHQYIGLTEIQRRIGVRELFDTLTVYESFPFDAGAITAAQQAAGLHSTAVDRPISTHYPLTLMVSPEEGCLSLVLQYRPDVFDKAAVQTTAARLLRVLEEMVASPDRSVSAVDVLSADERRRLLVEWPDTRTQVPDASLPELFEAQVRRTPARNAVVCGDTTLTYAQLNARANQLARHLIESGIGSEHIVALVLPRSVEMIVAVLGVLKAGAAYLPIDPTYPDQRVRFMAADAGPKLLITTTGTAANIPGIRCLVLDDPAVADILAGHPATDANDHDRIRPLHPANPAYISYTSGSTGTPKGVLVSHRNVVALFAGTRRLFDVTEDDVWSLFHSYAFDFSVWEMWGALAHGGRLVVISRETGRSPADFLEVLRREAVTVLSQTPSAFYQLVEAAQERRRVELALRTVVFGGEALDLSRLSAWYAGHPDDAPELVNMYGITETTVHVSHLRMNRDLAATATGSLIGAPLPGLRTYVLDSALGLAPIGVPGELYVGGEQLTRGYLGRAGLTASRFVADPYGGAGERLYRTGDLARWTTDGTLEFLGRADDQVKIRGFRIELGEIESVLAAHDGVAQAAVVARQDGPRGGHLAGYLVPVAGTGIDLPALREDLAARLPEHMVPAAFVVLDALPLTSNGKLDRRALPAPDFVGVVTSREPSTPSERVLSDLFADVLGVQRVGVDDSFFDLGGHSLLATRLVSRIRSARGLEVPIRSIFDSPTVAELAAVLDAGTGDDVRPPLVRVDRPDPVPLSFAQQRLWFLYRLEGPSPTYNIPFAARLSGLLDVEALRSAVH
ncbi:MAG: non-ribosomal peptide synthetase, partial [Micromonosporaceae bacterium]